DPALPGQSREFSSTALGSGSASAAASPGPGRGSLRPRRTGLMTPATSTRISATVDTIAAAFPHYARTRIFSVRATAIVAPSVFRSATDAVTVALDTAVTGTNTVISEAAGTVTTGRSRTLIFGDVEFMTTWTVTSCGRSLRTVTGTFPE